MQVTVVLGNAHGGWAGGYLGIISLNACYCSNPSLCFGQWVHRCLWYYNYNQIKPETHTHICHGFGTRTDAILYMFGPYITFMYTILHDVCICMSVRIIPSCKQIPNILLVNALLGLIARALHIVSIYSITELQPQPDFQLLNWFYTALTMLAGVAHYRWLRGVVIDKQDFGFYSFPYNISTMWIKQMPFLLFFQTGKKELGDQGLL